MSKVVAVIGASRDRRKFGNRALRAYVDQGYTVIPINPHETEVEGLKAYASVLDVPGPIDMASFYVPPEIGERIIGDVVANQGFELLVAASTTFAKDIVARAAGRLGGAMASDVVGHEDRDGSLLLRRPIAAGNALAVACQDGAVRIVELQRAGGRPMRADEFLRGAPVAPGQRLS